MALGVITGTCLVIAPALAGQWEVKPPEKPIVDPAFHPEEGVRPADKVPFPAIKDWSTLRIGLSRSGCYGTCPVYSVEILGDGTVNYLGERYVRVPGGQTTKISQKAVRDLYDAFVKADFFWSLDEYEAPITDLPTYVISISFDGHSKRVLDYHGESVGLPRAIADLEDAIDQAAGTDKWVRGTDQ